MTTCKKQTTPADSAMSAEGLGAHIQIRPVIAFRYFCEELDCPQLSPSKFYMDSEPFLKTITGKRGLSARAKHVLIQYEILIKACILTRSSGYVTLTDEEYGFRFANETVTPRRLVAPSWAITWTQSYYSQ